MEKNRKVIVITGATAGFGKACAHLFAKNGWDIVAIGRRTDRLEELQNELESRFSISVFPISMDVRDEDAVKNGFSTLPSSWTDRISILLNNAGLAAGKDPIDKGLSSDWNQMIDTNIKGLLYVSQAVIPFLKQNGTGHIINLGSIAGKEVYPEGNVYCATKHAVDALSRGMRMDLVSYGIKVTNIAPGAAETEFSMVRFKGDSQKANSTYQGYEPLVAEDIAETIWFVATTPKHVTINDLVIMPTAQASSMVFHKQ